MRNVEARQKSFRYNIIGHDILNLDLNYYSHVFCCLGKKIREKMYIMLNFNVSIIFFPL